MSIPHPRRRPERSLSTDQRGAAIIEFALCGGAFIALLVGTLQIALVFFMQQGLQTTAEAVARKVLTGQVATTTTQAQFRTAACAQLPSYLQCSNLYVDIRKAKNFSGLDTSVPQLTYDSAGNVNNSWAYDMGGAGDIVILRLLYRSPVATAPLGFNIGNQANGSRVIMGTMVFKSEPYA